MRNLLIASAPGERHLYSAMYKLHTAQSIWDSSGRITSCPLGCCGNTVRKYRLMNTDNRRCIGRYTRTGMEVPQNLGVSDLFVARQGARFIVLIGPFSLSGGFRVTCQFSGRIKGCNWSCICHLQRYK